MAGFLVFDEGNFWGLYRVPAVPEVEGMGSRRASSVFPSTEITEINGDIISDTYRPEDMSARSEYEVFDDAVAICSAPSSVTKFTVLERIELINLAGTCDISHVNFADDNCL
jgi:hypothetical protein